MIQKPMYLQCQFLLCIQVYCAETTDLWIQSYYNLHPSKTDQENGPNKYICVVFLNLTIVLNLTHNRKYKSFLHS